MKNREELITENINLVYSIVSKEYPTYIHDDDIIQSGMLGLCKAAQYWDEKKSKFSTYAWRCIRNEINNEFISRKPHSNNISLETKVGEDLTLGEVLMGDDNVPYLDQDTFLQQLTEDERNVFSLYRVGVPTEEIAESCEMSLQKTRKMIRLVKLKWRKHYGYQD